MIITLNSKGKGIYAYLAASTDLKKAFLLVAKSINVFVKFYQLKDTG